MQTESRSTGTPSSDTQSNLNNEELNETTDDFRYNSIKVHNDFIRLLQDNLNKVNTEEIQAELRQEIRQVQDENNYLQELDQCY
ncbi:hypothetical protein KSE1242_22690 (plasmid) [Staphylococcus epidermidis]